ncbi:MAG: hypothetical protein JO122_06775 [Acetobacteraceae bacterium]|nr:hypothetical protein [Acetobacteraceae bacterium]
MSDPLTRPVLEEVARRRRGRNIAVLVVLVALCLLFYAITIVKMTKS